MSSISFNKDTLGGSLLLKKNARVLTCVTDGTQRDHFVTIEHINQADGLSLTLVKKSKDGYIETYIGQANVTTGVIDDGILVGFEGCFKVKHGHKLEELGAPLERNDTINVSIELDRVVFSFKNLWEVVFHHDESIDIGISLWCSGETWVIGDSKIGET
ncbi:hypothetical protein RCL1_007620 [Eukaryota sp. TZLM3-RCL]